MDLAILSVLMFAAAIVFSLVGQGGGVLYTPLQVWFGVGFHEAATTALFLIMAMSLSSSLVFRKAQRIDWPMAIVLETATTSGAFVGGLWSESLSGAVLSVIFAAVVSVAAFFMIFRFERRPDCPDDARGFFSWRRTTGQETYCVNLAIGLPVSFIVGMLSSLVGVGGGILKVPMLVLMLGVPMDIAVGSSALMVGLTAAAGFAGHVVQGHWNWKWSLIFAAAVFLGAQIGSRISVRADKERLEKIFGWFLLAIAAMMVARISWSA
jgi:uncharacterized membrane protein YfcA